MILHTTGRVYRARFSIDVTFDDREPDILSFEFHTRPRGADWNIGRDLIAAGLMDLAGDDKGDVRIWPAPETNEVCIEFHTPSGHLVVRIDWDPIASFVRRTYTAAARGTEYANVDWDALPWRETAAGGAL